MSLEKLNYKKPFWPEKVFVEESAKDDLITKKVIARLGANVEIIPDKSGDVITQNKLLKTDNLSSIEKFNLGKKTLVLKRHLGSWLKACPGTSDHVCCNLWIVNPGEGCPMDCTYCYLQTYLKRNPALKIYSNISDLREEIKTRAEKEPNRYFRVGTGEVIDSLVWDDLTDLTHELVPFFASVPNITLELKSKHNFVDNLVSLQNEHQGKTVVSWSVNAKQICENDEASTSTLLERIEAAEKVVACGYKVGFHFDPLVYFEGWQEQYLDTIKLIFSRISPKNIAWISISSLRYLEEMQEIMIARFPSSSLPYGEQILASDNKLRYIQPIRFKMLDFVWKELKSIDSTLAVYMCMESSAAWRQVAGGSPVAGSELVEIFSRRGKLRIVENTVNNSDIN